MSLFPPEGGSGETLLHACEEDYEGDRLASLTRSGLPNPRRMRGHGSSETRPVRIVNSSFVGEEPESRIAFGPGAKGAEGAGEGASAVGAGARSVAGAMSQ